MSTITFSGNLAADPELRFTPSGNQVANLTVLENRRRQDCLLYTSPSPRD